MEVDITGIIINMRLLNKIARIKARISDTQKHRQKSQLNNLENSLLGTLDINLFLIPVLSISSIINATIHAITNDKILIKYIVDIIL